MAILGSLAVISFLIAISVVCTIVIGGVIGIVCVAGLLWGIEKFSEG